MPNQFAELDQHLQRSLASSKRNHPSYKAALKKHLDSLGNISAEAKRAAEQKFKAAYYQTKKQVTDHIPTISRLESRNQPSGTLSYPIDLITAPDKESYILFSFFQIESPRFQIDFPGRNAETEQAVQEFPDKKSVTTNDVVELTSRLIGGEDALVNQALSQVTGAFGAGSEIRQGSIALYIPEALQFDYSIEYEDVEQKIAGGLAAFLNRDPTASRDIGGDVMDLVQKNAMAVLSQQTQERLGAGVNRTAVNPHTEQIFRNVGYRNFSLNFKFVAESQKESEMIHKIIRDFKYYALPKLEKLEVGRYYKYPSEVKVEFNYRGVPNKYVPKIGKCVITNLSYDYAPNNKFAVHYTGSPIEIHMTVSLLELERIDQDMIKNGF